MNPPRPPTTRPAPAPAPDARAAPDRRAGRGRIIVLGSEAIIESVARATHRPTTLARHMYDVIGELVQAGVLNGPDAVVASLEALGVKSGAFVEAVRRIDPGVELIAISDGSSRFAADGNGFDSFLTTPLSGAELESAIAGQRLSRGDEINDDHETIGAREVDALASSSPPTPAPSTRVNDLPMDAALGDVDLVEAILHRPEDVAPCALRLIEQETSWTGLRVDAAPSSTAPSAEITARSPGDAARPIRLGWLIGPPERPRSNAGAAPDTPQLQPWADWLAPWLHLARTVGELRRQAMTDQLTGACNRRFFDTYLEHAIDEARAQRQCVSLLLFDIDDFKQYNDRYGHAAGDEILIETVRLLRSVIRPNDRVCRIGGDEFVVIFHDPEGQRERGSSHPDDIQKIARRFQQQICRHRFPKLSAEAPGTLTISGGLATFPWDGADVASLLEQADLNAMLSKQSGKNAITFGPGADDVCSGDGGVADAQPGR